MNPTLFSKKVFKYLWHRFVLDPSGAGKPVPPEALDNEYRSGAWDHFWGDEERERHEVLVHMIASRGSTVSLLDLGCGSGRLASMLDSKTISNYLGLDLSEEGLKKARSLNLKHGYFEKADYTQWIPSQSYDIITFNESLGYAPEPLATARSYVTHLNPQGCLIVSPYHYGNYEKIWHNLAKEFVFEKEQSVTNSQGKIWDLKILLPKVS